MNCRIATDFFTPREGLDEQNEDLRGVLGRSVEACSFLEFSKPGLTVDKCFFADGFDQCCVFAIRSHNSEGEEEDSWVIVGDIPPRVLD